MRSLANKRADKVQKALWSVGLYLAVSPAAFAISPCYQVHDFPSASYFEIDRNGRLTAYLNNRYTEAMNDGISFTYDDKQGWVRGESVTLPSLQGRTFAPGGKHLPEACRSVVRRFQSELAPNVEDFVRYRPRYRQAPSDPDFYLDQFVASCHVSPEYTSMGLGFYEGEGSYGYGGIARLDNESGILELARGENIAEDSIISIAEYNGQTFIGTTAFYECSGIPPTDGLLIYNWDSGQTSGFSADEVCGAVIHDMVVRNGELWLATDMGISRGTAPPDGKDPKLITNYAWKNYSLVGGKVKKVACKDLYHELLLEMPAPTEKYPLNWESIYFLTETISRKYVRDEFFREFFEDRLKSDEFSELQYDTESLVKAIELIKNRNSRSQ